ncbi:hypothetical protein C8F04DRAFT_1162032 [Mycena alexandri]|uniref:Uncharacterized protein n=1 Tax=Mycena alexandri TaxID=1745969 RepID=A0AAD6RWQ6_9AGAR|nr:hypothetical protein C8F04DRAFT_1162032 [Mycena alexandri]
MPNINYTEFLFIASIIASIPFLDFPSPSEIFSYSIVSVIGNIIWLWGQRHHRTTVTGATRYVTISLRMIVIFALRRILVAFAFALNHQLSTHRILQSARAIVQPTMEGLVVLCTWENFHWFTSMLHQCT